MLFLIFFFVTITMNFENFLLIFFYILACIPSCFDFFYRWQTSENTRNYFWWVNS